MKEDSKSIPKKNTFEIPANIIRTGKLLQFISTNLATNFAFKLFSTPPQFKIPEREEMMRKSAKKELVMVPEINKEIMVYTYGYSKTKIILTHGWAGRGTQLYKIADRLLENGMMIISFDAPAHGLSKSKNTNLFEYIASINYINEKYGPFDAAIGHSFGGITLLASQANKPFINKLAVIGIESSINKIIDEFIDRLQLKQEIAEKLKKKIFNLFNKNIELYSAGESAKKVTIPTLVIHDTKDYDVDVSSAFKIRQNLSNGELLITNGLGHRKILRDDKVIAKIINFLKH